MKLTTRSSIVPPIRETPKEIIWNSNVDLVVPRIHVETVYFYRPNGCPNFFDGDIVREAIGKSLAVFYPMAGRLTRQKDGRVAIDCQGQGVQFVEAEADATIDDFGDFAPQPAMQQLVPKVQPSSDLSSYPLLVLQVTRFKCGGAAFGVGMQHHVADGMSGIQFVNSISYFARGAPVTATPYMDRSLLKARDPPTPKNPHVEYQPPPTLIRATAAEKHFPLTSNGVHSPPIPEGGVHSSEDEEQQRPHSNGAKVENGAVHCNGHANGPISAQGKARAGTRGKAVAVFVLSKEKLAALKRKSQHEQNAVSYSTYEMLAGHIWKCLTKARGLDGPQPTKLYIATDGRARLVPRLPKDYFGNVVFTATPMSTAGDIVHKPLFHAAGQIHDAVSRMDNDYLRSALDFLQLQSDVTKLVRGAHTFGSPNLGITSWARLPVYDCDFGWGRPIFMGPSTIAYDGMIYVLPSPIDDGSLTLSVCLRPDYMSKFKDMVLEVDGSD